MSFVHLQIKSAYSLLNSAASIESLVIKAKRHGFSALALTDENVMYGAVSFYKTCLKHSIKPIIGLTVSVLVNESSDEPSTYPLVLLAKNNSGYQNLMKISSTVLTKAKDGIPLKWLHHYRQDLIAITPGRHGEIEQLLLNNEVEKARERANFYKGFFANNCFFFSIQQHRQHDRELTEKLVTLSKDVDLSVVATNDVHYTEKKDAIAYDCLTAIKQGVKLSDDHLSKLPSNEYYLKSPEEMLELFNSYPSAVANSVEIANRCNVEIALGTTQLPRFPVPDGKQSNDYLASLCLKGLKERYLEPSDEHYDRLMYELEIINRMKFSDYFLIVWDFMKYAQHNGILTGPGRGSAAGSLVAYVLYITNIDPIKHQLLFERFLNPQRVTMPDIDIDFPDTRRDEMIHYVKNKYGQLHVAQIITFGTLGARAALRDVGRVVGASPKEVDFLAKKIPMKQGITLEEAYRQSSEFRERIQQTDVAKRIYEIALTIEGLPRHTSTHAAGVIISDRQLTNIIPIQEGHADVYLTQYPMDILEDIGLLKMDFLGLRNLTLIENIITMVERKTGNNINLDQTPMDDKVTYSLLSQGQTTGVFQLESEGMRQVLKRLKPSSFEDIVAVNALYRPGPMDNIPIYIDRKHNKSPISYPHPDLESILAKTYGVIVYQEQIMQIAAVMAGFSLGEADLLRRAVSKKKKDVLDEEREHFVNGSVSKGYSVSVANSIYDLIVRFANYGFNRSHSVAYSMIAYHLAYLKANYPIYFYASILTSVISKDDKLASYIREAKQQGIKILPPSINHSFFGFSVEKHGLRFGLAAIHHVGGAALKEIFRSRKQKKFSDLFDFCIRTSAKQINRQTIESLVMAGCFDEFGENRATILASIDIALEHAELVRPDSKDQIELFHEEFMLKPKYAQVAELSEDQMLKLEKEAVGFYLSRYPTTMYEDLFFSIRTKKIHQLADNKSNELVKLGVYITNDRVIRTKKGEVMSFYTFSDDSGDVDAVAFPAVYKQYSNILHKGSIVVVEGKCERRLEKLQIIIKTVYTMDEMIKSSSNKSLYLRFEDTQMAEGKVQEIKNILSTFPGETAVLIYYEREQRTIRLPEEFLVDPSEECIEQMTKVLGERNVVLK
ncbi:DNA polymerase III subunit alpha [Cytobacillus sp. IB215665]|uniref:DNA polymerase III subunit alpha n=1 Tax=Cytobacillus sp. IB215665 TaxID=3097357 RepID=UPI002A1814BD|nr:DNA polymerase III subunit alpha [Cytobacillus sp. IB215665]MDX8363944.1 DNA polymerase III subunit alpha [Cytobacillus sp. IB215665]